MSLAEQQSGNNRLVVILSAAMLAIPAAGVAIAGARHPTVAILGALAIPVGGFLLLRKDAPAALFFFLLFLNVPAVLANFHGVPKTVVAASIGLLCIPAFRNIVLRREGIVFPRVAIWMAMFQLIQILGILVSARKIEALLHVLQSGAEGFAMFLLIVNAIRTRAGLRTVLLASIFAGGAAGAVTMHQATTKSYFSNYGGLAQMSDTNVLEAGIAKGSLLRHGGPIGEKNRFAQVLLVTLPFGLAFLAPRRRRWLPVVIGMALLMLAGIVLTRSRGGVLAALAMLATFIVIRRVPIRLLLGLALLAVPVIGLAGSQYFDRMGSIAEVMINASSGSVRTADAATRGRLNEMGSAAMMFFDHPITGVGPDMYRQNYRRYANSIGLHVHNSERGAHCMWLQVAAEHGTPGLLLFLTFCWMTATRLFSSLRATSDEGTRWLLTALLVSLLGYFASATFLSFTFVRYFWCILALCWCGIHAAEVDESPAVPLAS